MGVIRVDVDGRGWQTLGRSDDRGVFPDGIAPTWDGWGPNTLGFTIARDPDRAQPDLAAFTPVEWIPDAAGDEPMWSGFIQNTPPSGRALTVNAVGWSHALDDKAHFDTYAHEDLSAWKDIRGVPGAPLWAGTFGFAASGQVQAGAGDITFSWPQATVIKQGGATGILLDFGPNARGARVVSVDHAAPNGINVNGNLYIRGVNDIAHTFGGASLDDGGGPFSFVAGGTTNTAAYAAAKRYVLIFYYPVNPGGTTSTEQVVKLSAIRVFADDGYRTGSASTLRAHHVLARELTRVPVLSQDTAAIANTSFDIRSFGDFTAAMTPRSRMERANDYHRYTLRINARRALEFKPRPSIASLRVNTRDPGIVWNDATINSGEDVYNEVVVTGSTGSGQPISVTRTSSNVGIRNVLDRRGRVRSKNLTVNAPTDVAAMTVLADAWLVRYARTPLKGTLTVTGDAMSDVTAGGTSRPLPAALLGSRVGEVVQLMNLIDPDTGNRGRDAILVGGSYSEDADAMTFAVDNTRDDLDAVLARMAVTGNR